MSSLVFQKSQRKSVKIKLAITGPSGSGKTYSALRLATGLGGKIAVIDTENGSASLYSDNFNFDVLELSPPFTPEKYIEAIKAAERAKYDVLIIDSLSHEWDGEGGILQMKESLDLSSRGNSFTNWGKMTKPHTSFNNAYLHSSMHIIATMRSKQDYVIETNDKGKQVPKKIGLKPIQREGTEYEFTVVFDIAMNHEAATSKDRTNLFTDKFFLITEKTGLEIKKWIESAPPTLINPQEMQKEKVQQSEKEFGLVKEFNSKIEEFIGKVEVLCEKNLGFIPEIDNHFENTFRQNFMNHLKDRFIKGNGQVNLEDIFNRKLLGDRIHVLTIRFNAGLDKALNDKEIRDLKLQVYDECLKNKDANIFDIFTEKTKKYMPI